VEGGREGGREASLGLALLLVSSTALSLLALRRSVVAMLALAMIS